MAEQGPSVWSAPRDTREPQVRWVLKGWPGSRGCRDFQEHQELESLDLQVLLEKRAVQKEKRAMPDLQEETDYQEIQDQEDQGGGKERRVTHAKCARLFLPTGATQWLCEGVPGLKEMPDPPGSEGLAFKVQMAKQDRRDNKDPVVTKAKRESRALCVPRSGSYLLTLCPVP